MTLNLYIVRHGETEWNKKGVMQGHFNSDLTDLGKNQALKLSKSLSHINFDAVYTSTQSRAINTTQIILGDKDNKIIQSELIKEINMGIWQGMEKEVVRKKYPEHIESFWKNPHKYDHQAIKGESYFELCKRTKLFLNDIYDKHKNGNILIVSHGIAIKSILNNILNRSIEDFWKGEYILNTSVTLIEMKAKDSFEIKFISDVSHL
ncbi:histidine phosphatase family protein [Haliovirga abyssi]|uniref:Phosphatase n=1 Tax=Haliovirga abyssi TaxID=2996794 RepID=A0AAU9DA05_9FUSO|nr:histidine phosphatase family protein [Haliovirga abyssi]BDU50421.1 phosphatase [Haliovirga abyssi]